MIDYLNIHTHHQNIAHDSESILSLSVGYDDLKPVENQSVAIGIHPWFINLETLTQDLHKVENLANNKNVKMIGECGLDKLKGPDLDKQIKIFEAQLAIAKRAKKSVLIHCVKAYDELIASYKKVNPEVALVIHGFNKSKELGKQLMAQGFYLSFGKAILHQNSAIIELIKSTDEFFLETDDSEHSIHEIYLEAAKIKNCSVDELKALIFANWKKLDLL